MTIDNDEGERERRIGDLLPLAEALHDAIGRRLQADELTATFDIDRIIDTAFGDVAREVAHERLAGLSPVEFAKLYARINGDAELQGLLDVMRANQEAQLRREVRLGQISHEALTTGQLRLANLAPDEVIEIGLFEPTLPHLAGRRHVDDAEHRPLYRKIGMRIIEPEAGLVQVLNDTWVAPVWARSDRGVPIAPHARVTLGIPVGDGLDAAVSHRAPIAYREEDHAEFMMPPQIVGYVEMNSGEVLLGQ